MKSLLAKRLIQKGSLKKDSIITANYQGHALSCLDNANLVGEFTIRGAKKNGDRILFEAYDSSEKLYRIYSESIVALDGMPLDKIAQINGLTIDGDEIPPKKTRKSCST